MNNNKYRAHPITIILLLKSWWFVFTAPFARVIIQRLFSKDVQKVLLSEAVLLLLAIGLSIIGWLRTQIVVSDGGLKIKRGVLLKSYVNIDFLRISSVSVDVNLFYALIGCVKCKINTYAEDNSSCKIHLKTKDVLAIYKLIYNNTCDLPIKRQNALKRYISVPFWLVIVTLGTFLAQILFLNQTIILNWYMVLILCVLALFYGLTCFYDYKKGRLYIENQVFVITTKLFNFKTFCCNKTEVGIIKIIQNPIDRRYKTCKIKFMTVGESRESVKIKHIEHDIAQERIKNIFW